MHNVTALAVRPDGAIYAGGRWGLVRLHADGSLDDAFRPETRDLELRHITLEPDGGVAVLAARGNLTVLGRYDARGRGRSVVVNPHGPFLSPTTFARGKDGVTFIAGRMGEYGAYDVATLRVREERVMDASCRVDLGAMENVERLVVQPDGKLLAALLTSQQSGDGDRAVVRLDERGARDPSFGTVLVPRRYGDHLFVGPDLRLVSVHDPAQGNKLDMVAIDPRGRLDGRFDARSWFPSAVPDAGSAVTDGRFVYTVGTAQVDVKLRECAGGRPSTWPWWDRRWRRSAGRPRRWRGCPGW
jgi:hypothetical protein